MNTNTVVLVLGGGALALGAFWLMGRKTQAAQQAAAQQTATTSYATQIGSGITGIINGLSGLFG